MAKRKASIWGRKALNAKKISKKERKNIFSQTMGYPILIAKRTYTLLDE